MPRVLPFDRPTPAACEAVDEPDVRAVLQDLRLLAEHRPIVFAAVVKLARRLAREP